MPRQTPTWLKLGIGLAVLLVLAIGLSQWPTPGQRRPRTPPSGTANALNTDAPRLSSDPSADAHSGASYVGDGACVSCHGEIADSFHDHPMGRSLVSISDDLERPGLDEMTFEAGGREYSSSWRDGELIHAEIVRDDDGNETNREEAVIRFALGSGTRGISYLHVRDGGFLFQSPISWYSSGEGRHDLSPDYDRANQHFERPITPECLSCHSGRHQSRGGIGSNQYDDPIFLDHAISCERCHGPGSMHVENLGLASDDGLPLIVNPADLAPKLREAVCWQCHLGEEDHMLRAGASLADFQPGRSIEDFVILMFDERPAGSGSGSISALGHVGQMVASRCFQESEGRLGCISCHDPHQKPDPSDRVAFFRARCLDCHLDPSSCALPEPDRLASTPVDDCSSCHMPAAPMSDIAHTARALHSIPRFNPTQ